MSVWTEWDPLEEVIVGSCFKQIPGEWELDNKVKDYLEIILRETSEDLDNLSSCIETLGAKVYRPDLLTIPFELNLGSFNISNTISPIVPRDQYLVYGDSIIQTFTSMPGRYFDGLSYYNIFQTKFVNGYNWVCQPPPELKNLELNWQFNGEEIYGKKYKYKLLWHTATMFKCGDSIIVNSKGPGTSFGLKWIEKNLPANYIYNLNTATNNWGHIDQGFFMVNDDTVCCIDEDWVPQKLKNKKIINFKNLYQLGDWTIFKNEIQNKNKLSSEWLEKWFSEWKGYMQNLAEDFNVLVVDPNNVIFSTFLPGVFKALNDEGIKCHVCPIRHLGFLESSIHCVTLDLKRKGSCRSIL